MVRSKRVKTKSRACRKRAGAHVTAQELAANPELAAEVCRAQAWALFCWTSDVSKVLAAKMVADHDLNGDTNGAVCTAEWGLALADMERLTGKSRRWLFRHKHLPFIRVISRKTLVGDETLLKRWIANQRA